jgi:DNA-binding transcriptional MerR regulator
MYTIQQIEEKLDIRWYVLRYWEDHFTQIVPRVNEERERIYSERDVKIFGRIKSLLYEEGLTIAEANDRIQSELTSVKNDASPLIESTRKFSFQHEIRRDIRDIIRFLEEEDE